jgi:O-antigen/teichoic acid export membrane protein
VRFGWSQARWSVLRALLGYGVTTTVIVLADQLRFSVDKLIIGKMISLPAVGVFGVAVMVITYTTSLVTNGFSVLTPRFSSLDGARRRDDLRRLFLKALSISSMMAFGAGMLGIVFGAKFLSVWLGGEYDAFRQAAPVLWVLMLAVVFDVAQNPGIGLMYGLKKHRFYAIASIIEGLANVCLGVLLAPRYGIMGVAVGTAVPMLVIRIFVQPVYVARMVDIRLGDYWKRLAAPAAPAGVIVAIAWSAGMVQESAVTSYAFQAAMAVALSAGFVAAAWILSLAFGSPIEWPGSRRRAREAA